MKWRTACRQHLERRTLAEQERNDLGHSVDEMLTVIQQQQRLAWTKKMGKLVEGNAIRNQGHIKVTGQG